MNNDSDSIQPMHSPPDLLALLQRIEQLEEVKALLQTEYNLFTTVMDTIDALVIMLDRDGKIERFDRAFELHFGAPGELLTGQLIWDLPFFDAGGKPLKEFVHTIREYLEASREETSLLNRDGERRVIAWTNEVFWGENGDIEYVIATGVDITARKQVERLLRHEQALLRCLINSIPDLIFYKDVNGKYLGCNPSFEAFSGHSLQEITADRTDYDFYPPDVAAKFITTDQQVMTTKETVRYENRISRDDKPEIILETRKTPYYGPDGELLGVIGIGRDITKQKLDEEALREANAEIAQLIASFSSILIVVSPEITVLRWNPPAQRILGIPGTEVIGKPLQDLKIPWEWDVVAGYIARCQKDSRAKYLDPIRFKRTDGSEGYLGINISPMFDSDGSLSGYILLGNDITERKQLETQLTQAQKLKSIGQLAAGIAHEINTPIQYVGDNAHFLQSAFSDLLAVLQKYRQLVEAARNGPLTNEQNADLESLIRQVDLPFLTDEIPLAIQQSLDGIRRVSEIVRAMKEFSHPGVVKKVALDINKALDNTITVARNEWKYVADIETKLAADLPHVICIPGEINQVFLNVIVNAAQAIGEVVKTESGEKGKITIETLRDGDWVEIRISDTGPGISNEIKPHIYEPFFTTKEVGKGTGQGLAIAYNVIELKHAGKLTYETRFGSGTTFIIRLPIQPPPSSGEM